MWRKLKLRMRNAQPKSPRDAIFEALAKSAGVDLDVVERDPFSAVDKTRIYNYMARQPGTETVVPKHLVDDLIAKIVRKRAFLFDAADFGQEDHYALTDFMTSRLRSKLRACQPWIAHPTFPRDIDVVCLPSAQPYAYSYPYAGQERIVVHYGLTQLVEFAAEIPVIMRWIEDLKRKSQLFQMSYPLVEQSVNDLLNLKIALAIHVQSNPFLLPGIALGLPTKYWLELVMCVALSEAFVCAHEHVHATERPAPGKSMEYSYQGVSELGTHFSIEQKRELATDLQALYYFDGVGWSGVLDAITVYFMALGHFQVQTTGPSRTYVPVANRIDNLLAESVGALPASMFPARLVQVMEYLKANAIRSDDQENVDWRAAISNYTQRVRSLASMLAVAEKMSQRAS